MLSAFLFSSFWRGQAADGYTAMSNILNYASALSGLLPLAAAGLRYRTYRSRPLQLLAWFFGVSALFDLAGWLTTFRGIHNMPLFQAFAVVNLLFLCQLYALTLHGRGVRGGVWAAAGAVLVLAAYAVLRPAGGLQQFPSLAMTAECGLFITLALTYFYQLLHQAEVVAPEHNPLFWVNAGVLVYFSGNLFLFMLQAWISRQPPAGQHYYWAIHSVANIVANCLYAAGLLCKPPPPLRPT